MSQIKLKKIEVELDKLVTNRKFSSYKCLFPVPSLNQKKGRATKKVKEWIKNLMKVGSWDPILVTPIKDTDLFLLSDGWHRVQASKFLRRKTINALEIPVFTGSSRSTANRIVRQIKDEYGYKLNASDIGTVEVKVKKKN